ncbi:MAG TPA: tyrosine-type recombinase/integrase, partial [Armatimonadota bacterium]|nr:tyrosine-type recombinase/integrase [Armatimonadota bacterium]
GFDGTGKRNRKHRVFHGSEREAIKCGQQLDAQGTISTKITVREWCERWLDDAAKKRAPRTVAEYKRMLQKRVYKDLGQYRLEKLEPHHIAKWISNLEGSPQQTDATGKNTGELSQSSILKYFRVISVILQDAVYLGLLTENPARKVRAPRMDRHQARFYDQMDTIKMWEALQGEPLMWRAIISTSLLLGIRRGELIGLKWMDIDFEKHVVRIERAAYKLSEAEQEVKSPKTATSLRALPLDKTLATVLQEWHAQQQGGPEDFVCAEKIKKTGEINWLHVDAPTKWFSRFTARHSLPSLNLHGLRHTTATLMLTEGVPINTVSEFLGHAKKSTTLDTYSHDSVASKRQASETLSNAVSPKKSPNGDTNE